MSYRPKKKKKVVDLPGEDHDVDWTPPPNTTRDRIIQVGVFILILVFLLPMITCSIPSGTVETEEQVVQVDEVGESIARLSAELNEKPNDVVTLANLGYYTSIKASRIEDESERMTLFATAEDYLKRSLEQDPNYSFAQTELARNLLLQDKEEEAAELIDDALGKIGARIDSEDEIESNEATVQKVQLLMFSAEINRRQNNYDGALENIDQAIELRPGEPQNYLARAELHRERGDKELARADYEIVVDIGQKMGNQEMAMIGQMMLEQLNASEQAPDAESDAQEATQDEVEPDGETAASSESESAPTPVE